MTHSNHRRGNEKSLSNDYVVLVRNTKDNVESARKAVKILANNNPVGVITRRTGKPLRYMRGWTQGLSLEEITNHPDVPIYLAAVYDKKEDVKTLVNELKQADLGFSIVISGLFENVFNILGANGLEPHTVNMSLNTLGRTELLPDDKILEMTTMCGHGLISENLVRSLIDKVRKNQITVKEASIELGKPCICNFFNHSRAEKLIKNYIESSR
jgi:hypothetical protein